MENVLPQIFNYKDKQVRTVIKDGDPWFVAKDVCDILEIGNSRMALDRLDEDEKADVSLNDGSQNRSYGTVNESGLYNLVLGSRKPEARDFKRWITHDVIPSIRKHGGYLTPEKIEEVLLNPDTIIRLATDLKTEREKRLSAEHQNLLLEARMQLQDEKIAELAPKAQERDDFINTEGLHRQTDVAKLFGITVHKMNAYLVQKGVLFKKGQSRMPKATYIELGYYKVKMFNKYIWDMKSYAKPEEDPNRSIAWSSASVYLTHTGIDFVYQILLNGGIINKRENLHVLAEETSNYG